MLDAPATGPPVKVTFVWPSSPQFGGGAVALYEYANALARRGHEVHLVHGPARPGRIESLDELGWFSFAPTLVHHVVDSLDDPSLPLCDVVFPSTVPDRLGLPAELIQGYGLLSVALERPVYRARCPKICVAEWLIDIGVAWGSPREQMLHVPLGMDHGLFRQLRGFHDRPVDVAFLYNDHPVKGGADAMAALEEVHRRRPGLRVEAFGLTEQEPELPDWVHFHRFRGQETLVTDVYNRAKVFVQPSWREGFGLTAVEAMACGCALVTTDNGGSRDYAHPEQTAVVVPVRDPSALGEAIDGLLADDGRRVRLAEAGERLVRRFDWDRAGKELEAHLERYLADPGRFQAPPSDAPMFLEDVS